MLKDRTTYADWLAVDQTNAVAASMRLAGLTCQAVIQGSLDVVYISGPPGVGKNMAVRDALDRNGVTNVVKSNPTDYKNLLSAFKQARERAVPLWLDEADVIFNSLRMLNVLKIATGPVRDRTYNGKSVNVPKGILVCTNADLANLDWLTPPIRLHAAALFSRSKPITVTTDVEELWEYSVMVAMTTKMIWTDKDGDGIPIAIQNEALDWFTRNLFRLEVVAPRTLWTAANLMNRSRKPNATLDPFLARHTLAGLVTRVSTRVPPLSPQVVRRAEAARAEPNRSTGTVEAVKRLRETRRTYARPVPTRFGYG